MPFESKAQAKWMFANKPEMAQEWASKTKNIKKLPVRKDEQASLNITGKLHRIYREKNGDVVVNHAGSKKQNGKYDKINLSDMAGVKSVKGGVKAAKDWHKDNPHTNVKKYDTPAWTRSEGKNPEGGLNAKGRASAKAEGHNLKPPVKSGDNPRRKSFLSRMGNMPGPEHKPNGEPTRLLLSLNAWGASSKADAKKKAAAMSVNKGLPSIARSQYKELKASGKLVTGEKYEGAVNPDYLLGRMRLKAYGEGPGGKYHVGRSGYTRGKLKSNPTANRSTVELRDATDQRRLLQYGLIPTGTKKTKYGRVDSRMKSSSYKESNVGKGIKRIPGQLEIPNIGEVVEQAAKRRLPTEGRWKHLSGKTSRIRIVGPSANSKDSFDVVDSKDVRRILPRSSIVFVKPRNVSKSMEYSRGMYSPHALPKLDKNKRYDGTDLSDMSAKDSLKNNVVVVAPAVGSLGLTGASIYNSQKARKIVRSTKNNRVDHFVGLLHDNPHQMQAAKDQSEAAFNHAARVFNRSKKQLKGSAALLAVGTANNVRVGAERHKLYKQKNGQNPIIKSMNQSRFGGTGAVGYNIEDIEKGVRLDKFAGTKAGKRYLKYDAHILPKRPKRDEKGIPYLEAKYKATKDAKRDAAIGAVLAGGTGTGVALSKSYDNKPKPVWEKPNPNKESDPLSKKRKASAKARAKAAGRPYPNLIDNMAAARSSSVNKSKSRKVLNSPETRKAWYVGRTTGRKTGFLVGLPAGAGAALGAVQANEKIKKAEPMYDAQGNLVNPRQPLMSGNAKLGAVGGAVGLAGVQRVASAGTLPSRLQGQADAAAHRVAFQERLANEQLGRVQAANQLRGRSNRRRQTRIHQYHSNKAQANLGEARAKQIVADNALKAAPRKKAAHIKSGAGLIATGGSLGALAIYNNAQDRKIKAKAK